MNFEEAVASAFRRTGDFKGRATRPEYWYFFLLNALIQISAAALDAAGLSPTFALVAGLWSLVALVPGISLFIRRLRDGGYSPWFALFVLAGPLGAVVLLVLLCQRSAVSPTVPLRSQGVMVNNAMRKDTFDEDDLPSDTPRKKSAVLGWALAAVALVVIGSIMAASVHQSALQQASELQSSSAAAAAYARSVRAAADSSSAAAARDAATKAEASRAAQAAETIRLAQASRSAEASRSAQASAQAFADARAKLIAQGWSDGPDGVFYRWVPAAEASCPPYQGCVQLKVTTPNGCANGVSVEASGLAKGTVTGNISGYSPGFLAGQNALVTLSSYDKAVDNVTIKKMRCN